MLSLEESRKNLNGGKKKYTDEEIKMINDFLYRLARIHYESVIEKIKSQEFIGPLEEKQYHKKTRLGRPEKNSHHKKGRY